MALSKIGTSGISDSISIDTDTLVVDGVNNRVGIGTVNPTLDFSLAGLSVNASGTALQINNIDGASLRLTDPAEGGNRGLGITIQGTEAAISNCESGSLRFGTGNAERMKIDSSGNVTMPYQPYFMGVPQTDYSSGSMPTGVMSLTATLNNGNHFNTSNSRFVAPVAGFYWIHWGGLQLPPTVTSLMLNGSTIVQGNHYNTGPSYITVTQGVVYYLNANDYLEINQWNGGGYYNTWWHWSVALLG